MRLHFNLPDRFSFKTLRGRRRRRAHKRRSDPGGWCGRHDRAPQPVRILRFFFLIPLYSNISARGRRCAYSIWGITIFSKKKKKLLKKLPKVHRKRQMSTRKKKTKSLVSTDRGTQFSEFLFPPPPSKPRVKNTTDRLFIRRFPIESVVFFRRYRPIKFNRSREQSLKLRFSTR